MPSPHFHPVTSRSTVARHLLERPHVVRPRQPPRRFEAPYRAPAPRQSLALQPAAVWHQQSLVPPVLRSLEGAGFLSAIVLCATDPVGIGRFLTDAPAEFTESVHRLTGELAGSPPLAVGCALFAGAVLAGNAMYDRARAPQKPATMLTRPSALIFHHHPGRALMVAGISFALLDLIRHYPHDASQHALGDAALGACFLGGIHLLESRLAPWIERRVRGSSWWLSAPVYAACAVEDGIHFLTGVLRNGISWPVALFTLATATLIFAPLRLPPFLEHWLDSPGHDHGKAYDHATAPHTTAASTHHMAAGAPR